MHEKLMDEEINSQIIDGKSSENFNTDNLKIKLKITVSTP